MVSKNQLKQILKLKHKKYRTRLGYFVAEGEKIVNDLINSSWHAQSLYSLEDNFHPKAIKIDSSVMKKISHLKTPSPVLGVFKIPNKVKTKPSLLTIAIDKLIDPGNLGSIIRLCDWFGVNELVCSSDTVDCYNSKVIQSSMGSIARVKCVYMSNLHEYLKKSIILEPDNWEIYGLYSTKCNPCPTEHLSSSQVLKMRDKVFHE